THRAGRARRAAVRDHRSHRVVWIPRCRRARRGSGDRVLSSRRHAGTDRDSLVHAGWILARRKSGTAPFGATDQRAVRLAARRTRDRFRLRLYLVHRIYWRDRCHPDRTWRGAVSGAAPGALRRAVLAWTAHLRGKSWSAARAVDALDPVRRGCAAVPHHTASEYRRTVQGRPVAV